uniref:Stork_head domain-containing protein n=1 Tax=Syphacia muris TaxID=451379 RepID=A0A0N5AD58_9BILA
MSRTLIPQCIGIIFQNCYSKRKTGHKIFESFKEENRHCFWNLELIEAVDKLVYVGFIRPGTLFISSTQPEALDIIRYAWTNRILRPAKGYIMLTIGNVPQIQLHEINQNDQQPIADMVCGTVAMLNRNGYPATPSTIALELNSTQSQCPERPSLSIEQIQETVNKLLKAELIYRLGENLFLSKAPTVPYLFTKKTKVKCNAECQTGKSIICSPVVQELAAKHRKGWLTLNFKFKAYSYKIKKLISGLIARIFTRKNSPAKVAPRKRELIAVSTQAENKWTSSTAAEDSKTKSSESEQMIQRLACYASPVIQHRQEREHKRFRLKQRRGEPVPRSSPECLDYGPIDPPECLPYLGAPESLVEMEEVPRRHLSPKRQAVMCTDAARTSTPVPEGSDSAYSMSPVITEMSSESREVSRSSSLSGLRNDLISDAEHTYVNMCSHESTQFEEITQIERLVPVLSNI